MAQIFLWHAGLAGPFPFRSIAKEKKRGQTQKTMEYTNSLRIAFTGKMATGKSTAARLVQLSRPGTEILSLGASVKEIARNTFGMKGKDRRLLQIIGNTGRALDPLTWVNLLLTKVKAGGSYVVDDVRFEDEAKALREHGFVIIRLEASDATRVQRIRDLYRERAEEHLKGMNDVSENGAVVADAVWTVDTMASLERYVTDTMKQKFP